MRNSSSYSPELSTQQYANRACSKPHPTGAVRAAWRRVLRQQCHGARTANPACRGSGQGSAVLATGTAAHSHSSPGDGSPPKTPGRHCPIGLHPPWEQPLALAVLTMSNANSGLTVPTLPAFSARHPSAVCDRSEPQSTCTVLEGAGAGTAPQGGQQPSCPGALHSPSALAFSQGAVNHRAVNHPAACSLVPS